MIVGRIDLESLLQCKQIADLVGRVNVSPIESGVLIATLDDGRLHLEFEWVGEKSWEVFFMDRQMKDAKFWNWHTDSDMPSEIIEILHLF